MNIASLSLFARTKALTRYLALRTQLIEIERAVDGLDGTDAKRLMGLVETRIRKEADNHTDPQAITKDAMQRLKTSNTHLRLYAISGWLEAVLRETVDSQSSELTDLNRRIRKLLRQLRETHGIAATVPSVQEAMRAVV